jgi:hypothetical protein
MTDLEARLRREMEDYVRATPVGRPPVDELLSRASGVAATPAWRSDRARHLLAVGVVVAVAAVVAAVTWRSDPGPQVTATPTGPVCPPSARDGDDHHDEVVVFVDPDVTAEQTTALTAALESDPRIERYRYVDRSASLGELRCLFRRNSAMLARIEENPQLVPISYRLELSPVGRQDVDAVVTQLAGMPGVAGARSSWPGG